MGIASPMRRKAAETADLCYGAVVVQNGVIIGWAPSSVIVNRDPTAQVGMEAMHDASAGVLLFSSRSCPMCEGGGYYASIERIYAAHTVDGISNAGQPQMTYYC